MSGTDRPQKRESDRPSRADALARVLEATPPNVAVLVLAPEDGARSRLETTLERADDLSVVRARTPDVAREHLETIDCVVLERDAGADWVDEILADAPPVPVVVAPRLDEAQAPREDDRGETDANRPRLVERVRRAVADRRGAAFTRRLLSALEATSDGLAIVTPDRTFAHVNRTYARRFGYEPETLTGRPWTDVYPAETVDHLERRAIPTVTDGWRWTGTCTGRRRDEEPLEVRTALADLEDGWLCVSVLEPSE